LLISILLPTLGRARRAANTVACAANLRSIIQGMNIYASQNMGAIPGSGWTTARLLYINPGTAAPPFPPGMSNTDAHTVVNTFDWASPIMRVMGVKFRKEGRTEIERLDRWDQITNFRAFQCPENQTPSIRFGGTEVVNMLSYNTAIAFMMQGNNSGSNIGETISRTEWDVGGYTPKLNKVGSGARKIFIADGARYSNCGTPPDWSKDVYSSMGGPFGDQGAWARFSNSWNRGKAPLNVPNPAGTTDARIYAYRHGYTKQYGRADMYKANFGFFDGHVELLGDLESARPELWLPKGTRCVIDAQQVYTDVKKFYFQNPLFTGTINIP
jgi:prepilin-type processing-associated H-X9-DG protein